MKKVCIVFLLALTVLFSCSLSYGADRYEYFATGSDGDEYYVDTQSIAYTNTPNVVRYWEKVIISNAGRRDRIANTKNKEVKNVYRKCAYVLTCIELNFEQNKQRTIQSIYYSSNGRVLYIHEPYLGTSGGWSYIPPNTIAESERDAVKRIIQNNTYQSPRQPFVAPQPHTPQSQLPMNTPQQRESYRKLQEYNTWLQSQPDYPEFDRWFSRKLQEAGVTAAQVNAGLIEYVRQLGWDYENARENNTRLVS